MVSLADGTANNASGKQHRLLGHSMRTFRPKHLHNLQPQPPPPPPTSSSSSHLLLLLHLEDTNDVPHLSDSLVDLHLHHLASSRYHQQPPLPLSSSLDPSFSLSLSDPPSFTSDISAELLRLLSPPPQPTSTPPPPPQTPSSPSYDDLPIDALRPTVDIDVSTLTSPTSPLPSKRAAASRLRLLAKHRSDLRSLVASSGAIPALVPLLRSPDPNLQETAATALLNLSLEPSHRTAISAAGAIKPLVYALRTGTPSAKQNAACALLSLSHLGDDHRSSIGAAGAIPPLVTLIEKGTNRGKKDALTALYKLLSTRQNKERAVSAGAVAPLVAMVAEDGRGTAEKAVVLLGCLAGVPEGRSAIVEEGGVAVLVEALEGRGGWGKGRELAVHALLQLCVDGAAAGGCRSLLVGEGAIPPLVELSQTGSAVAKQKAETLLEYLRVHRQHGASAGS